MSKSQINLPKTAFSMKANLPVREPEILEYWKKINLYQELRKSSKGKEKFVLHDGPPYANGNIHMGTALNKILKDIIVKFHQMDDKDSIYVPGWDCHGLPIEWKIEEQYKKNKQNKNEVPIVEFRKECRAFAEKWIEVHKEQFKRLGVIGDWENYYSTMSYDAEAQIVRELGKFLKEGSLYRGFKPVLWSTVEKTALADAEVEYHDHKSDTIYTSFPIKTSNLDNIKDSEIIIWTTTPWTIPANKALAYNESLDYLLIQIHDDGDFKDKKIIIAEALLDTVIKECEIKEYSNIKKFKGKEFKGTICKHPFFELGYTYDVPMLEARFVTTEQGTSIQATNYYASLGLVLFDATRRRFLLKQKYKRFNQANPDLKMRMQREYNQRIRQNYPWTVSVEGEVGRLNLIQNKQQLATTYQAKLSSLSNQFTYAGVIRVGYQLSEYASIFVKGKYMQRSFVNGSSDFSPFPMDQVMYSLQAGITMKVPGTKRCKINGCGVVMKHRHNGIEYRGSSIFNLQNRKIGQWY